MESMENHPAGSQGTARSQGSVLLDFLAVVTRYRRFITPFVLGTTVLVTIIVLLVPKWYKATASVFPAEKADLFGALDGVSSLMKSFSPSRALSSLTGNTETDRYTAILKSRSVLDSVIVKFDLVNVYDITSYPREKTTKELLSNVDFIAEPEGNLTVTVFDTDPQRAADMANYFVDMLNKTNIELQVQNARGNKGFIEQRYQKNLVDLARAEDSLKAFQQRYGVIAMPQQTEASIKAGAELTAQLALKEVQQGVLRQTQAADHPAVLAGQVEINELQRKLEQMNSGSLSGPGAMNVFVPFKKVPQMGMEYLRLYREVEIQYKILQFITPLFEQAKVEEKRQTPSVVVLDRAVPAERKSKPKILLWALIAFVGSALVSVLVVFTFELVERLRTLHPDRLAAVVKTLRADWFGLRVLKR
jgi:tyrosine-protein kinase Etk/Wzc